MSSQFSTSVTRIADLEQKPYQIQKLDREHWRDGDYLLTEVFGTPNKLYQAELPTGRMVKTLPGDTLIGALGHRAATLECVGTWHAIGDDCLMHAMTGAGLLGKSTSMSALLPECMRLRYEGHIVRNGVPVRMPDFAVQAPAKALDVPVVLLVGTSMSAGKTTAGRLIVHELASQGLKVVGMKLTGAGRYRDVLSFQDAGASAVFDFVDAGLPSTVVSEADYLSAIRPLIAHVATIDADVVVVEAGASPMEPYNGAAAISEIGDQIRCTVLCASDPYAVVGVREAFGLQPDLVTGPATNTTAGTSLVKKLTGIPTVDILGNATGELQATLGRCLSIRFS